MNNGKRTNDIYKLEIEAEAEAGITTAQHAHFTYRHFFSSLFIPPSRIIIVIKNYSSLILLCCVCLFCLSSKNVLMLFRTVESLTIMPFIVQKIRTQIKFKG